MDKEQVLARYKELLDEEAVYIDCLYELAAEEYSRTHDDNWEKIKEAKRKVSDDLNHWWEKNKEEYLKLQKRIEIDGYKL